MSKNITIQEGGVARTLSGVEKIVTNVAGENGTQNWVPEDEAAEYVSTGELSVSENGTYYSRDDGYVGFSKVEVNVESGGGGGGGGEATLITKEITEDGTYDASDDDADGYSSVTVNVGSGGTLITKQITQNGTYNASDDSVNGYSSVTVNVSYPHGSVIVDGINHAPVNQRISTREFLEDFNEQWFLAIEQYIPSDSASQLRYEDYTRGGGWIRDNNLLWLYDYNNIVIFAKGGMYDSNTPYADAIFFMIGIADETATISISDIVDDSFKYYLYYDNKFIDYRLNSGALKGNAGETIPPNFGSFKSHIDSHQTGATPSLISDTFYPRDNFIQDNSRQTTGWITNLTGGIRQNIGGQ